MKERLFIRIHVVVYVPKLYAMFFSVYVHQTFLSMNGAPWLNCWSFYRKEGDERFHVFLIMEPMLVLQAFVLHFHTFYTCLSRNEQPYAAPSTTYRSCSCGGGARLWRCILGRIVQGRSKWFPLVFLGSPSGCASRMITWCLLSW